MGRIIGAFLLLVVIFLILYLALQNPATSVDIDMGFFGQFYDVQLVLALFVAFVLGSVVTFLYLVTHTVRQQFRIRKLANRTKEYEAELTAIRNIPVESADRDEEPPPVAAVTD